MAKREVSYYSSRSGWKEDIIERVHNHLSVVEGSDYNNALNNGFNIESMPSDDTAAFFVGVFNTRNALFENALCHLFDERPAALTDEEYTFIKVSSLNDVYSTRLSSDEKNVVSSVLLEFEERLLEDDFDETLVQDICQAFTDNGLRKLYSFVTKYCSKYHENRYPIYDRYVSLMLRWYRDCMDYQGFMFDDSVIVPSSDNYVGFVTAIESFRDTYDLGQHNSFRSIDKYLWCFGKTFFPTYVPEEWLREQED